MTDRYNNSFSKTLGGVSLMDFGPTSTSASSQFKNWAGWMGDQQECRVAVWLEIDRDIVAENLLDAEAARRLWHLQYPCTQFIPGVEACHQGPIPLGAIVSILLGPVVN